MLALPAHPPPVPLTPLPPPRLAPHHARPRQATEAQLRAAFEPAGFVWELTLPRSASGRGRGFAFVGFTQRAAAERGIKMVNGQAVAGRPVAVDWAVAKAQYGQQAAGEGGEGGAAAPAPAPVPGVDSDLEGGSDDEGPAPAGGRRLVSAATGRGGCWRAGGKGAALHAWGAAALRRVPSVHAPRTNHQPPTCLIVHARQGHESDDEEGGGAVAPDQERRMLSSVVDGILGGSGSEGEEDEEDEEEQGGSSEEEGEEESGSEAGDEEGSEGEEAGSSDDDGAGEAAAAGAPPAADPFSRKQLAAAAAGAADAAGAGAQRARPEPEAGATVFIRGLALDVTKEQVFTRMKVGGGAGGEGRGEH